MRFSLATLTAAQSALAQKPSVGAESNIYVSSTEMINLGKIVTDSGGVASWKPRPGAVIPTGEEWDIHLRSDDGLKGLAGNPTVTFDVTIGDAVGAGTALATLVIPSYVTDQSKTWPVGTMEDFIPQGVGNSAKSIESITALNASTNLPANTILSVWASPPVASFSEVGYCKGINGPYQVPGSISIADRYESAAAVKKGRSQDAELSLEFNHISSMEGMGRYNGHRVTIWNKVVKDKTVHSDNIVYTGLVPEITPNRGDGDDPVMETTSGPYEKFFTVVAP